MRVSTGRLAVQSPLDDTLRTAHVGCWQFDPVTSGLAVTDTGLALLGLAPDAPVDTALLLNRLPAAEQERLLGQLAALEPGRSMEETVTWPVAEGETRLLRLTAGRSETGGSFGGTLTDVTSVVRASDRQPADELAELIKEFKFVTDFMPQMVWATQPDGYHDFYNKRWYDFTGLSYEQTKNEGWARVLHPDDAARTWAVWKHSLATGDTYQIEYRMRRYDGVYRWFLARAMPLRNEDGQILKWFGTCTDIQDQKIQAQELERLVAERTRHLQEANVELRRSNDYLQQFAFISSHDLKEPLRKIQTLSDLLVTQHSDQLDERGLDLLQRLQASAGRMGGLVQDLMAYAQTTAPLRVFEPVSLGALIHDALTGMSPAIEEAGADIAVDTLPTLTGDAEQLAQLFQNLLVNALKFRRDNTPVRIRIACRTLPTGEQPANLAFPVVAKADAWWEISLHDNGIGFSEQHRERIFQVFQRLHGRGQYSGNGIGLAICRRIVENHGGAIGVDSVPGEGTTFRVYLPR